VLGNNRNQGQFPGMAEFKFEPPIMLTNNVSVSTLDDAAECVRTFHGSRRPLVQESVLRRLEGADTPWEQRNAADAFIAWAQDEGLLLRS
jgi:hypothetical protein